MAQNPKNSAACKLMAKAIAEIRRTGSVVIDDQKALLVAYAAMIAEPGPCDGCYYETHPKRQKCACCARNYRNLKDCYERG